MSGSPPLPGRGGSPEGRPQRPIRRYGPPPATRAARAAGGDDAPRRPRAGRPERPGRHRDPRASRPRSRINRRGRVVLALLGVAVIAVLWFVSSLYQPFHGDGGSRVAVRVPRASGVGEIAKVLEKSSVVSSSFFFQLRARLDGKTGDLKPGAYSLRKDMSYEDAIAALEKGPAAAPVVTLLVPEGKSRREIAVSIKSLSGNYLTATKRSRLLDPARYGAKGAHDLEGFLFPASYQLKKGSTVDALVAKQLTTFKQRFATVNLSAARHLNLTPYDVLIIASLVERETAAPEERGLIASVIYNRLHEGIPLGIDATTRFQYNDWTNPLRQSQLASPSPYNTRIHQGLPPGPIGSPGLASIRAAARPARSKFLYYVANPCKPGTHTFVRTGGEFDAAVAKYNAARARAGGKAPKGC